MFYVGMGTYRVYEICVLNIKLREIQLMDEFPFIITIKELILILLDLQPMTHIPHDSQCHIFPIS